MGDDHPDTVTALHNLATIYHKLGRHDEAEKVFLRALEMRRKVLGVEHPRTLTTLARLGTMYAEQGRHQDAAAALREVYFGLVDSLGSEATVQEAAETLASIYASQGRSAEANEWRGRVTAGPRK